jgi:hypothetical protein
MKSKTTIKPLTARTDLRQCPHCPSKIRLDRYEAHVQTKHLDRTTASPTAIKENQQPAPTNPAPLASAGPAEAPKSIQQGALPRYESATALDKQGRRACAYCPAMVKPTKYDCHVAKVHRNGKALEVNPRGRVLLTVHGLAGTNAHLNADDLAKLPQHSIKTLDHGAPVTLEGVLLADLLAKVTRPTGEKFLNTSAWYYVLAEGLDGNRAVFAWAELDPTFTDRKVYVINRDDQRLRDNTGSLQLLVPGDRRTTRWLRQLSSLKIKQAN